MQFSTFTEEAIQSETFVDYQDDGVTWKIKKRYLRTMILIVGVAAFLPSYYQGTALWISYVFLAQLLGSCYTMYQNLFYFQQFSFRHRPLLMTKYFQLIAIAGWTSLLIYTIPMAHDTGHWIQFILLWAVAALIPFQFFVIFTIARSKKK